MKFTVAATLIAGVAATSNVTYVTEVVTALTTFCPAATQITHNGVTYTVTEATTLTITDCPCTISKPVYSTSYVSCQTCVPAAPAPPASYPVSSAPVSSAPSYPTTYPNGTVSTTKPVAVPTGGVTVTYPTGTATGTATPIPTAGAAKAAALSGAGLAGVLGLVAYIL